MGADDTAAQIRDLAERLQGADALLARARQALKDAEDFVVASCNTWDGMSPLQRQRTDQLLKILQEGLRVSA